MNDDPADRIRRQMQDIRRDMGVEMSGVVESAQQLSDWRYYMKKYPWVCIGAALAVGFALSPKKRSAVNPDVAKLLDELRRSGIAKLAARAAPAASFGAHGLSGRLIGLAAPLVIGAAKKLF